MAAEDDFVDKLAQALARLKAADPSCAGSIDGSVLSLRTVLSRDEAAELLFGLQAPRGFKWMWSEVAQPEKGD